MSSETPSLVIDVRLIPPPQRHPMIFDTFDGLEPGGSFILVNDHEPRPLYYQFLHERTDLFTWDYVESGPTIWRVRIGRKGTVISDDAP